MTALIHFDAMLSSTVQGPKGDQGEQGPQGVTGEQGPQGPIGPAGEIEMPQIYMDNASPPTLIPNYRIMFTGSGDMAFDFPVAADHVGAVVSVTDITGTSRSISFSTAEGFGEVIHAPPGAATMTAPYSSRTFVAIAGDTVIPPGWIITSSVGA